MTTTEQITKDQQIQNQSQTIQSLERKVESLETELRKCLDIEGDSDTTRNSKADVFRELSDDEKQILLNRTVSKAKEIIRACLGFTDENELIHSDSWTTLRNVLLDDEKVDGLRANKHFKYGLQILMYIIDTMREVETIDDHKRAQEKEQWIVGQLLENNEEDYNSLLKLIEAFNIVTKDAAHAEYYGLNPEDVNDLRIGLTTIESYHRMVLDAHAEWGKPRKKGQLK